METKEGMEAARGLGDQVGRWTIEQWGAVKRV